MNKMPKQWKNIISNEEEIRKQFLKKTKRISNCGKQIYVVYFGSTKTMRQQCVTKHFSFNFWVYIQLLIGFDYKKNTKGTELN